MIFFIYFLCYNIHGASSDMLFGGVIMAYFLKKSTLKGRTYLSIVESFYSHDKRGAAHRTYKSLASVETWKAKGIDDPIAYFQKEVDTLNDELSNNQVFKIFESHELYFFAFLLNKMNIKRFVDYFNISNYMHNHFFRGEFKA